MKKTIVLGLSLTLLGCVEVPEVQKTNISGSSDSINTVALTCKSHYPFTQDCNVWLGATRKVNLDGFEVKVGGTADGKAILVMDAKMFENSLTSIFTLNSPKHSRASNNSFYAVEELLKEKGVEITRVRPMKSFANIDGYILELNSDGYSFLKEHTVPKS